MQSIKNLLDQHLNSSKIDTNYINFLKTNSKLIKDDIFHFSIGANLINCKFAGSCKNTCYAKNGFYNMPNVKRSEDRSKELSLDQSFVSVIDKEIKHFKRKVIRIHSSGDFYSLDYANKWNEISLLNPEVIFYAYVKSLPIIRQVKNRAPNFIYIQSLGTLNDKKYINYSLPYAEIFYTSEELQRAILTGNYIDSSDKDINTIKAILTGKNVALFDHDSKKNEIKLFAAIIENDLKKIIFYGCKMAYLRNQA